MKNLGLLFFLSFIVSCSSSIPLHTFEEEIPKPTPEYNNLANWMAHPNKFDGSDLLPENLISDTLCLDSIDVFYVYPTIYTKGNQWNADINDLKLNQQIDEMALQNQANVFSGIANIYSPTYRQMHYHGYKDNSNGVKAFDLAYSDIENAFKYYLKHFNKGNRIVLAAHSQGTHHLQKLFTDYLLKNDTILKRIELAYLVGDRSIKGFTINEYPLCEKPTSLNCFLSWNSYKNGFSPYNLRKINIPVSNPVSWLDNGAASLYNEHGGILFSNYKFVKKGRKILYPKMTSAITHNGLLWVTIEKFPFLNLFEKIFKSDYHIMDYNLFWMNIRQNFYDRMSKK